ncbi:MAG: dienelactone hydrolase family protein [Actinomycetota bacterium]|jgi:carboxymethylenebutenolidase|nr:dienelactone hydrolase family protein [Actinomycetota bacterium]
MTSRHFFNDVPLDVAGEPTAPRAAIVIQEAFGVNDHIRDVTERFAQAGYYAVAPELFHRGGSPEIDYDNFPDAMAAMAAINAEGITHDLEAASGFLKAAGYNAASTAIVGYCMGGTVTFYAATRGLVGAAASFYGGGIEAGRFGLPPLLELAPQLRAPWIGLYGDLDKGIPVEQVEALRIAAASSHHETTIVRYPDADHGFHCDGRPGVFNSDDAVDAHRRTLEFFSAHLESR